MSLTQLFPYLEDATVKLTNEQKNKKKEKENRAHMSLSDKKQAEICIG